MITRTVDKSFSRITRTVDKLFPIIFVEKTRVPVENLRPVTCLVNNLSTVPVIIGNKLSTVLLIIGNNYSVY
jgi:hypothetical protein